MSNREKLHKMLDLVLDIVEGGHGSNGYPFVDLEISNYPQAVSIRCKKSGFDAEDESPYDFYSFSGFGGGKYDDFIDYLECLAEKADKLREDGEKDVCRD